MINGTLSGGRAEVMVIAEVHVGESTNVLEHRVNGRVFGAKGLVKETHCSGACKILSELVAYSKAVSLERRAGNEFAHTPSRPLHIVLPGSQAAASFILLGSAD